ncbi:hypothetical protein M434DRAFT_376742, partial [Hypoxylon sp. CO27-5]
DQGSSDGVNGLPQRPGFGTQGNEVTLKANHVKLEVRKGKLYRYKISFAEEEKKPTGKKLARVIKLALEEFTAKEKEEKGKSSKAFNTKVVTDFSEILIASEKLLEQSTTIVYRDEVEDEPRKDAPTYQINIKFQDELSISNLLEYIKAPTTTYEKESTVQALNIFLNHYPELSKNHVTTGPGKCYQLNKEMLEHEHLGRGLIAAKGYYSSISVGEAGILANINVTYTAFYPAVKLGKTMYDYTSGNYNDPKNVRELGKLLRKVRVQRTKDIRGEMAQKAMTIFDLASSDDGKIVNGKKTEDSPCVEEYGAGAEHVKFWYDNEHISVFDFFQSKRHIYTYHSNATSYSHPYQKYNIGLDNTLPVINVGTRESPTYLPAEHCEVLPGQKVKIDIDRIEKVKKMTEVAVRDPWRNALDIENHGLRTIGLRSQDLGQRERLENFGVSIPNNSKLITVRGRTLAPPVIYYHTGNIRLRTGTVKWNLQHAMLGKYSKRLLFVDVKGSTDRSLSQQVIEDIHRYLKQQGITTHGPKNPEIINVKSNEAPEEDLKRVFSKKTDGADCIIVRLPNKGSPLYNCIKRFADRVYGIRTVCIVKETKSNIEVIANIALKLNLKFGENNQTLDEASLSGILDLERTMIVGVDVTHSPEQGAPSIAGMVASVGKKLGQWPAVLRRQEKPRQEMVTHLEEMLDTRLQLWRTKNNGNLPKNILVYRDGVSEGQYKVVRNEELPKLKKACQKVYGKENMPDITIVIVAKRHHTRFYTMKNENPTPGTIVDHGVTDVFYWDFFLQPHKPLRGAARPTHYFVVHDQIFRKKYGKEGGKAADKLETFTHNLCFIFGRTTGAVSICTPAYYADIACTRARCYVADADSNSRASKAQTGSKKNEPAGSEGLLVHPNLKDSMFYI